MTGPIESGFDAFLSYTSNPDYRFARELETYLQRFYKVGTPENRSLRALRICVDGSDFSLAEAREQLSEKRVSGVDQDERLKAFLATYLARCRYLIVLCAGREFLTRWQQFEVGWWLEHKGSQTLFLAVTRGEDPAREASAFFPDFVVSAGLHQRVWFDLRAHAPSAARTATNVRDFEEERLRLTAELYETTLEDLQPLWFRQERRRARRAAALALAAGLVFLALAGVAWVQRQAAREEKNHAEVAQRRAEEAAERAELSRLSAVGHEVDATLSGSGIWLDTLPLAMSTALHRLGRNPAALRGALARAAFAAAPVVEIGHLAIGASATLSADNRIAAIADVSGTLELHAAEDGNLLDSARVDDVLRTVAVSRTGGVVVTAGKAGARIWGTSPLRSRCIMPCRAEMVAAVLSPDEQSVLATCTDRSHPLYEVATCTQIATLGTPTRKGPQGRLVNPYFADQQPIAAFVGNDSVVIPEPERGFAVWSIQPTRVVARYGSRTVVGATSARSARRVLAFEEDDFASVWNLSEQLKPLKRLEAESAAISPDGGTLLVRSDQTVELDAVDANHRVVMRGTEAAAPEFSMEGDRVIGGSGDGTARVWDVRTGALVATLRGRSQLLDSATIASDGKRAVTSGRDGVVRIWDLSRGISGHANDIAVLQYSSKGQRFVSGDRSGGVELWDVGNDAKLLASLSQGGDIFAALFDAAGRTLVTASSNEVVVRDANDGRALGVLEGLRAVTRVALSADGSRVYAGGILGKGDNVDLTLTDGIWNAQTGQRITLLAEEEAIRQAAFLPNGDLLLLCQPFASNQAGRLVLHEAGGRSHVVGEARGPLEALAVSGSGKLFATIERVEARRIGRVWRGAEITELAGEVGATLVDSLEASAVFSPDERWLATSAQGPVVQVWNVATGQRAAKLGTGAAMVDFVEFLEDGSLLHTHDRNHASVVWDAATGEPRAQFDDVDVLRMAPNGSRFAAARGRTLRFFDFSEQGAFREGCSAIRHILQPSSISASAFAELRAACEKGSP